MHIITGATGHVGSAVTESLLKQGENVLVITRSKKKAENWIQKGVEAVETPQSQWIPTLRKMGFSAKAAKSMANMTSLSIEQDFEMPDHPYRGRTSLKEYMEKLAKSN